MSAIVTIFIVLLNSVLLINSVKAATLVDTAELSTPGYCGQLLKFNGMTVKVHYVEYTKDGVSYPAYCLNKPLDGITEDLQYSVTSGGKIDDIGLWRVIINGYPYKSIEELGVANKEEAFTATKQAIYCYLYEENDPSMYEGIGEAGERTLNALWQIIRDSQNSTETQCEPEANVVEINDEWIEEDEYFYKEYSISSNTTFEKFNINIEGELKDEIIITDVNGEEKTDFKSDETFIVKIPKESMKEDGSFSINVKTETKTKPVIYGASPNAEWQSYALTGYTYEDAETTYEETYNKYEKPKEPEKVVEKKVIETEKILPVTGM